MANKNDRNRVLIYLKSEESPLSLDEIRQDAAPGVPERTLRRWLTDWVESGVLLRTGVRRSTRYVSAPAKPASPGFLETIKEEHHSTVLKQLRDLWTHTSTALEGNTLSLGDTHFILEEGLTVSGKPLKDHEEVVGHARAIELVYGVLGTHITEEFIFDLHKAVQTERVIDICKPCGAWKNEANGTYVVTNDNQQTYIEYALPREVPRLMKEIIEAINAVRSLTVADAAACYAKIHAGIVHVHPFWDGNGRVARLLANIPLLKNSLPPLVIFPEKRRQYIELLAAYEIGSGRLTGDTGVWPREELLEQFTTFCEDQYRATRELLERYMF
ncbi:MAG: Fic family protein [Pseudohongiellaceae bacterium]